MRQYLVPALSCIGRVAIQLFNSIFKVFNSNAGMWVCISNPLTDNNYEM
jgi:hypothetical protein